MCDGKKIKNVPITWLQRRNAEIKREGEGGGLIVGKLTICVTLSSRITDVNMSSVCF